MSWKEKMEEDESMEQIDENVFAQRMKNQSEEELARQTLSDFNMIMYLYIMPAIFSLLILFDYSFENALSLVFLIPVTALISGLIVLGIFGNDGESKEKP